MLCGRIQSGAGAHDSPSFPHPCFLIFDWAEFKRAAQQQEDQEHEEEEDDQAVRKAREWDDWKDTHPRGYGNRQNMG